MADAPTEQRLADPSRVAHGDETIDGRFGRARRAGVFAATVFAITVSARSGIGLATMLTALVMALWWVSRTAISSRATSERLLALTMALVPWLVIRDNVWLAISIVCTVALVLALVGFASATEQSMADLSLSGLWRRVPRRDVDTPRALGASERMMFAVVRGVIVATPIVGVFWALLASADDVFAEIADPSLIPFTRGALFVVVLPVLLLLMRVASVGRPLVPLVRRTPVGTLEATIVLSAVALLFTTFIGLRISSIGRDLTESALRTEVRSGFFQLLWVALLTVVLVLVVQMIAGSPTLEPRLRRIALLTVGLAAAIDGLALLRIAEYVNTSFLSPLRFWSFGAGLWLLVVLGLAALRIVGVRAHQRWFTVAVVTSWIIFVFAMGAANPDERIAEHNFANPPTGEDEWIAVRPLMWLSEDATPTIIENLEVLRPMPDDRYGRMVDHLCSRDLDDDWRDGHFSRRSARAAIEDLC